MRPAWSAPHKVGICIEGSVDPFGELEVFDAVQGLHSTLQAAELLGIPQSSVSRRYRQFATMLRLDLSRQAGRYEVIRGDCILNQLRQLAQRFRFLHHLNRWAPHPALAGWLQQPGQQAIGRRLDLPLNHWGDWLEQRLLDQVLDCQLSQAVEGGGGALPLQLVVRSPQTTTGRQRPQLALGDWATLDGLAELASSRGWTLATPHDSGGPVAHLEAQPGSSAADAFPLALSWRYGPSCQQLDGKAALRLREFETLFAYAFGFHSDPHQPAPAARPDSNLDLDLDLALLTPR